MEICQFWQEYFGKFQNIYNITYHKDIVTSLYVLPQSGYLISSSYDGTLGVWKIDNSNYSLLKTIG